MGLINWLIDSGSPANCHTHEENYTIPYSAKHRAAKKSVAANKAKWRNARKRDYHAGMKEPLDYAGPGIGPPSHTRPNLTPAERYERNGWIGLAITLALCLLAFLIFGLHGD